MKILLGLGIFTLLISGMPLGYSSTLGEDWSSVKSLLSEGEKSSEITQALDKVNQAKSLYENSFKQAALELDPESNSLIENAFSNIVENHNSGDLSMASLNRQVVDKTIYTIAYLKIDQALDTKNSEQLLNWFTVMESKFKISEKDNFVTNHALAEIAKDSEEIEEYADVIRDELLGIFKLKTVEELEEAIAALESDDVSSAKKFTYEGLYYYRTLHPSVVEKLGNESASELLHEMEEAVEITTSSSTVSEMIEELKHVSAEVELIIREYEGGNTSEIGLALSGIKDRVMLVEEEYLSAVSNGQIVDQEEYDETVVFLKKSIAILNEHKPELTTLSTSDANSLESNLLEIEKIVNAKDDPSKVSILVGKSLNNLASLEALAGGAVQIDAVQYIEEIEILLQDVKEQYRNGQTQEAFDLATTAYLDNYEFVEDPLSEVDPELMVKIEIALREDLRNMIKSNAPANEIDAHVDMILSDLAQAKKVVPEFGTIVMLVLVLSVSLIILTSRKLNYQIIRTS
nr:PEFG-CTERM sorting domain-containing protein [Nitrosopumilus sp. K4]